MERSAMSRAELVHAISVEPLTFFYASLAYSSYRDSLLHFLALIRLRVGAGTLVLAPSSIPLRLHLFNIPNEITHEIYDYLFHSLIETEKLQVLDRIGLCPHSGACTNRLNPHLSTSLCPTSKSKDIQRKEEWASPLRERPEADSLFWNRMTLTRFEIGTCDCDACSRRRREVRSRVLDEAGEWSGVCWVDVAPKTDCCFLRPEEDTPWEDRDQDAVADQPECDTLQRERAIALGKLFVEAAHKMRSVTTLFNLTLFSPPSSVAAHNGEYGDDLALRPALIGIGSTVPSSNLLSTSHFNLNTSSGSLTHAWNEQTASIVEETSITHFYVPESSQLTEEGLQRFERFGRSLRLPREEGVLKVYYDSMGPVQLGQGRGWRPSWKPSLMVVNKLVLSDWRAQELPRWE